ncbi:MULTISPECIES: hypothetical protein [Actinoplanes]|uniref:hypothetical protein n=1 Tax=Actinoplanes TaxID=1865 RepID=UPI0005F2AD9E|nr:MULTISPECIES: hypothetical protein [Actinoplanes]GLY00707.1 hypothetical protein Acsp01_10860 [Actinoplanes sp. NBRC 101535]
MASRFRDLLGGGKDRPEGIVQHTVGNALVVHTEDKISPEAQSLALSMIEDTENDVVVLDLGDGMPITAWESMAVVLPRRRRGIRLVACGRHRNSAAMAGQWLSERLNRTVIAPDGELVRGSAGALFVHSAPGSGWVKFRPGRPPTWDAKRYPTPLWDRAAINTQPSSATGEIEPIPAGVWIHSTRNPEVVEQHRQRLTSYVPCHPDTMTVLLGCPGTPALSLDDVVRFWRGLDEENRQRVRFAQFGDVRMPEGEAFGQALADLLNTSVVCYTGMPIGSPQKNEIRTVLPDGTLGWAPFALELVYVPRAHPNSRAKRPTVLSHRPPLNAAEEIAPRVYWFAPGAVVEVVQTGLWVRSAEEPKNAEQVRSAMLDAEGGTLVFDDTIHSATDRMRELAVDLAARVSGLEGTGGALMPASVLVPGAKPASRAQAVIDLEEETRKFGAEAPIPAYVDIAPPAPVAPSAAENVVIAAVSVPAARFEINAQAEAERIPLSAAQEQVVAQEQQVVAQEQVLAQEQVVAPAPEQIQAVPAGPAPIEDNPPQGYAEPVDYALPAPPSVLVGFGAQPIFVSGPTVPGAPEPVAQAEPEPPTEPIVRAEPSPEPPTVPMSFGAPVAPVAPVAPEQPVFATPVIATPVVETPAVETPAVEIPAVPAPVAEVVPEPPTMPAGFGEPVRAGTPASPFPPAPTPPAPTPPAPEPVTPDAVVPVSQPEPVIPEPVVPDLASAPAQNPVEAAPVPEKAPEQPQEEPEPAVSLVEARWQPVPSAGASALLREKKGLADERGWLRRTLSREFDVMASSVSRIMSEHPGMQGSGQSTEDVLADAVALRLYLTGRGPGVDAGLRSGRKGPHVPFARCVVSGLSRMSSFRGTTIYRISPTDLEWELYEDRRLVTDWGFVNALTQPCSTEDGDTDVLIWSMTARRTTVLEPDGDESVEDRVLYLPGTNFKVLELRKPSEGERGAVLMREIGANEIDDNGKVDSNRVSLDELAVTSLRRSVDRWAAAEPRKRIGAGARGRLRTLPGLERIAQPGLDGKG